MRKNIDGFIRVKASETASKVSNLNNRKPGAYLPKSTVGHSDIKAHKSSSFASNANNLHSTRTKKAKTLMRSNLKKPIKTHISPDIRNVPFYSKISVTGEYNPVTLQMPIDFDRLKRAQKTPHLKNISRFGAPASSPLKQLKSTRPTKINSPHNAAASNQVAIVKHKMLSNSVLPSTLTSSQAHLSKMLDDAMTNSNAHKLKHPKKSSKSRYKSSIYAGAAGLLLFVFFAYQNIPNMSVRIASNRSGVKATIPGYRPSGFALNGPVRYSEGILTMNFSANADKNRSFNLTEQLSDWNNETLVSEFLSANGRSFQTIQDRGKTIYIYEGNGQGVDSSATWINKGTWYTVEDKANLNSDQLLKIVQSI